MTPQPRKTLNPRSANMHVRFAIHLRGLLERRKLSAAEFQKRLDDAGLSLSRQTIQKWLSADRLPRPQDLETVASVLRVRDYRHVLPPPI